MENENMTPDAGFASFATAEELGKSRDYGKIAYYLFLALAFSLPLWFLPFTANPLDLNKAYLAYFALIVIGFLWIGERLRVGAISFAKSSIFLALIGIIVVFGVSSIFSIAPSLSFAGVGNEATTFVAVLFFSIAAFLASIFFSSESHALKFYIALFASGLLVFILQFFQTGLGIFIIPFAFFQDRAANLIGSWNELGIFFGFIALSAVLLSDASARKIFRIIITLGGLVSLAGAAFVNFTLIWWVLAPFFIVIFTYRFITQGRAQIFSFTTFALIFAIFFIFGGVLMSEINNALGLNILDIRPTIGATWDVIRGVVGHKALLGSGPNTFLYDWLRWKPQGVNNTIFWASRFQAGFGTLISNIANVGILGALAFLAFLFFFVRSGIRSVLASIAGGRTNNYLLASFFGALYLWVFAIFYSPGFLLFFLAFLVTGIFIGMLTHSGLVRTVEFSLFQNKGAAFVWTLFMVFLIILGTAGLYLLSQKYVAEYSFGEGVKDFNIRGDINAAEAALTRAARFDKQDRYFRALTEIGLVKLNQLLARRDLSQQDLQAQFQNMLGATVQNARFATDSNPIDPLNWMTQGKVFEAIIPFKIAGSAEAAKTAYAKASDLSPQDPDAFLALARVEIQNNNLSGAKEALLKSVAVKGDYAPSQFLLSQVEARSGNMAEAISRTETTVLLTPNDIGALFQLGLLQYQQNNLEKAQAAFERAIALSANYSNARYFLGLIYDKQGRKEDAIAQFEKIAELNPGNSEVQSILKNLQAGKSALFGISPPGPTPEKRNTPPVREKTGGALGE